MFFSFFPLKTNMFHQHPTQEINHLINSGTRISHILTIKLTVSSTTNNESRFDESILQLIQNELLNSCDETIYFNEQPIPLKIKWINQGLPNAYYYYTDSPYNDEIVATYTRKILKQIKQTIDYDTS